MKKFNQIDSFCSKLWGAALPEKKPALSNNFELHNDIGG